jgi:hypothetical protein
MGIHNEPLGYASARPFPERRPDTPSNWAQRHDLERRYGKADDKAARQSAAEAAARQGESQVDYADLAMYSPGVDVDAERTQTLVKAAKETPDTTTAVQQTFLA